MKALPKKLLALTLFGIAVTSLFSIRPAQANYIVTLQQVGPSAVATGSGAFDLTGLTSPGVTELVKRHFCRSRSAREKRDLILLFSG
jgi:hypothetical protein